LSITCSTTAWARASRASFIADSCACIPGRGTLYAANRVEAKIRSGSENWSKPVWYLKCDLANFFVSIDMRILRELLAARIHEPWWLQLAELILFNDPRRDVNVRGDRALLELVRQVTTDQPTVDQVVGRYWASLMKLSAALAADVESA
jgi:hypothetical protein